MYLYGLNTVTGLPLFLGPVETRSQALAVSKHAHVIAYFAMLPFLAVGIVKSVEVHHPSIEVMPMADIVAACDHALDFIDKAEGPVFFGTSDAPEDYENMTSEELEARLAESKSWAEFLREMMSEFKAVGVS